MIKVINLFKSLRPSFETTYDLKRLPLTMSVVLMDKPAVVEGKDHVV